jgi:hypothetical protein
MGFFIFITLPGQDSNGKIRRAINEEKGAGGERQYFTGVEEPQVAAR